jgi:preprotein translocase subunit SecD
MSNNTSTSFLYYATWKKWLTVILCLAAVVYAAPNLVSREITRPLMDQYSRWVPVYPVNLGLDLQGGSYLLLGVDVNVAMKDRLSTLVDAARAELQKERIGYLGLAVKGEDAIGFSLRESAASEKMRDVKNAIDRELVLEQTGDEVTLRLPETALLRYKLQIIEQSIEIVRRRIDETGTREPLIQRSGDDRILLQLPGVSDPEQIKRLLGQTAKMTFHLVDENATLGGGMTAPPGYVSLPDRDDTSRRVVIRKQPSLSGETLTDAQASVNPTTGQPAVHFRFDAMGARRFAEITKENVGQQFAIVLDNQVITAPVIREPITGGSGQIDGNFTVQGANELSLLLRAGALPAPLTVLEERTVGPGLGQDAVDAGKISGIVGFALVVVFMIMSYGRWGVYASIALTLNVAMLFAALSLLGATLTLPGIAGIVLTIGMAVDANVLIYERVREELRNGRTVLSAFDTGYSKAMAAIVDSNLTTIIAGLILFMLGSGPVKGFAVTLTLGIVTSMFSAIMVTRIMVLHRLRSGKAATVVL